jgi:hypothetical protein
MSPTLPNRVANTPLAALADHKRSLLARLEVPRDEHRVRLACHGRAQQPVIELGEPPPELCARARPGGDGAECTHAAPRLQPAERPHGDLLQADDPRLPRGDELDHLPQEAAPLRRRGVAVEEIPRANEDRHAA